MTRVILFTLLLVILFSAVALAVMPPAPPEWYARKGIQIPEGIKKAMPPMSATIAEDMAKAARLRPNNTDHILVILVEFSDHPANTVLHPREAYNTLLFSVGVMPTGSMVEYYQEVSYGAFTPEGVVTAWITAPHPYSYYVNDEWGESENYPYNSQGLLEDCVNLLDPTIDFSQFDNNGDGYAEGIFMVHAGQGAEETGSSSDIWSHSWYYSVLTDDGVYTGRYSIEPEELAGEEMIKIGVFCHEYGHLLGLEDLYISYGEGVGVYCLMSSGAWGAAMGGPERPTHLCAEMKRRLGWMTPIEVTGNLDHLAIPPAETDPVCYKITNPVYPDEYFLLENRAKIGFDSLFRGDGGLAIWHVDHSEQMGVYPYVSIEQADGNFDLDWARGGGKWHPRTNKGDAGDLYPGACGNTRFSRCTRPNNLCYYSFTDVVTLDSITQVNDTIYVDLYATPDVSLFRAINTTVHDTVQSAGYCNRNGDADSAETIDLTVTLTCDGIGAANLTGTLATADPRVEVIDEGVSFGLVAHGDTVHNESDPFRLIVRSGNADSAVTFNLQLNADGAIQNLPVKMNINRQKVLIVLDNNQSHWSDNLLRAMERTGCSFDVLRITPDSTPAYDVLIPYPAILWTSGSYFGRFVSGEIYPLCLTTADLTVLQQYLDQSGRLGLFSQDYLYDNGLDAFASTYLHVGSQYEDIRTTAISGEPDGAFAGFDGVTRQWSYYDYTDHLVPIGDAVAMVNDVATGRAVAIQTPATVPATTSYAATFSGLGIERLDSVTLDDFLQRWLGWILTNTHLDVPWAVSPRDDDTVITAHPTFGWTSSSGAATYQMQVALGSDFEFADPILTFDVLDTTFAMLDSMADGAYYWRVNATPEGGPATAYSPRARFIVKNRPAYICGDANGDETINVGDAVHIINYVFKGGPEPAPLGSGDANCDGTINVGDAVHVINYVFKGGDAPCCP